MKFKTREIIKELEKNINNSYTLPIFKGYKALNKAGVEKLIDELYANLPEDIKKARKYLKEKQYDLSPPTEKENILNTLQDIENKLDEGYLFAKIVIINVRELETLLNKLQNNLPADITKAEILDK